MKLTKPSKTLIAGAALGAVAGAYIATHKKEIKDKVKDVMKSIADAGMAKLMKGNAAQIVKAVVATPKKATPKKTLKSVK
jgi:2-iminoacetate synthase ThiH